jgi:hypothetical protein
MAANTGNGSFILNIFQGFSNKVDTALLHESIRNLTLQITPDRPIIEGHFYVIHYIADIELSRLDLGNPLHLAALLPILVQNPDDVTVGSELSGIYAALLAQVQSLNALFIGEITAH